MSNQMSEWFCDLLWVHFAQFLRKVHRAGYVVKQNTGGEAAMVGQRQTDSYQEGATCLQSSLDSKWKN